MVRLETCSRDTGFFPGRGGKGGKKKMKFSVVAHISTIPHNHSYVMKNLHSR